MRLAHATRKSALLLLLAVWGRAADSGATLPGSSPWALPPDIVSEQYAELRAYYEREIAAIAARRQPISDIAAARAEFRKLIGAVDTFLAPKPRAEPLADFGAFTASLVSWPILAGGNTPPTHGTATNLVREYGILLAPKAGGTHPAAIVIADANQSAADICGLTQKLPQALQPARRLAGQGFVVFAPFFTQRRTFSEPWTEDRSWLFRLAYQTGHHPIGSEVQQVSSAYDFLATLPAVDSRRIAVAGRGQGGLLALYATALDDRIQAALVSGYFDRREKLYEEPEDRIVWRLLIHFGDAEIASMASPRELLLEGGGPGAGEEFRRVRNPGARLVAEGSGLEALARGAAPSATSGFDHGPDHPMDPDRIAAIANAQFSLWQARYRNLALESYAIREAAWKSGATSIDAWERWARPKREDYLDLTGRYPAPSGPFDAQSVRIYDEPAFTGYRLSLRLYEGVRACGILLVPKGIRAGERRPVVFTQHGHRALPEDALGVVQSPDSGIYSRYGMKLAQRGYIVFAPMISTWDSGERDRVSLRSHLIGQLPVGIEAMKFERAIDYLSTLPFVDKDRFAMYGLSYGGYTALWTGPLVTRFRVVIASGHFNDWTAKTTDLTQGTSFLFYPRNFDQFNFDLLNRFSHAEIAMLVAPRPFMIEIGDGDGVVVAPRRLPEAEMRRVEDLYRALGIPERGRVARFDGPHKVDGTATFDFLDRWMNSKAR